MSDFTILLRFQFKLITTGDRILYFYLISVISFVVLKFYSFTLLWHTFLAISNVYLLLLYSRDADLKVFYNIFTISKFKIHAAKISIMYLLSFLQLVLVVILSNESYQLISFIVHFLTFYTSIIFYDFSAWLKLLVFICAFVIISLILYVWPPVLCSVLIFIIATLIIIRIHNEQTARQKSNLV